MKRKSISITIIILALAISSNVFGQGNKRKRIPKKVSATKSKTRKAKSSARTAKEAGQTGSKETVSASRNAKALTGVQDGTSNTRKRSYAAYDSEGSMKLDDIKGESTDNGHRTKSSNATQEKLTKTEKPFLGESLDGENIRSKNPNSVISKPLVNNEKPFIGDTLDGNNIKTQQPKSPTDRPDVPKPELKTAGNKLEKPTKTEKPKRQTRRSTRKSNKKN
ncbi:MAG: hypothetical protein KDB79_13335 [Acidobacteria bacterium]|nr:hypothetical protein [Acidobacteriota bacterium]